MALSLSATRLGGEDCGKCSTHPGSFSCSNPSESGQAMVEFVLAAITFLFVILGVIQLALFLNAKSLVQYAAYNAARAAAVHGGNREKMEEAARLSLIAIFPRHGRADTAAGFTDNYLGAVASDKLPGLTYFNFDEPITSAKIVNIPCGSTVTFDDVTQSSDALITVQVVHHYELIIPLVNRIVFLVRKRVKTGGGYHGESIDTLAAAADKERRTGTFRDVEFRIPIVAHYTTRMQSDLTPTACEPEPTTTSVATTTTVATTSTTVPASVVFNNPQHGGVPLDHCLTYGTNCGWPAADAFCQSMGFTGALAFTPGPKTDHSLTIGSNEECDRSFAPHRPPFCGTFNSITCI